VMFNLPGGPQMVGRMLLSSEGRETAAAILSSACLITPDPYFLKKLPPYKKTAYGNEFEYLLSSEKGVNKLIDYLKESSSNRYALLGFFEFHSAEARGILRDLLSTEAGVKRMYHLMISEPGRDFLELLGEKNLGLKIGGDDLWLLGGGRSLVRKLLETEDGQEAVFRLVTGFSFGSSIINVIPLRAEISEHKK